MLMFEIGEILIHDIMYVATYVKVKCIGEVIWKLMAERGEGVWGQSPQKMFLLTTPFRLLENVENTL